MFFFSALLLHSGHTSKLQFFHCFSIVSRMLYAIMVPHRSLNFTWHHFTLSLFFPPFLLAFQSIFQAFYSNFPLLSHFFPLFYVKVPPFFHCFSHHFPLLSHFFPIVLCHIPHFFYCFSHHFHLHCNLPRSTSEGGPVGNRYPNVTQLPPGT